MLALRDTHCPSKDLIQGKQHCLQHTLIQIQFLVLFLLGMTLSTLLNLTQTPSTYCKTSKHHQSPIHSADKRSYVIQVSAYHGAGAWG